MMAQSYAFLSDIVLRESGIVLSGDKSYLLHARLGPLARSLGHETLDALAASLRQKRDTGIERRIVDALTTNETSFFRDSRVFDFLRRTVIPGLLAKAGSDRRIRVWSAACSTGQEAYSIAMLFREIIGPQFSTRVEILGTDISPSVLERARRGTFSDFEIRRGLEQHQIDRFMVRSGSEWSVIPELRSGTRFTAFNLLADPRAMGRFDLILCRNVLIYFNGETKSGILARLAQQLEDHGYLFLGSAETVLGVSDKFVNEAGEPAYRKRGVTQAPRSF